MLSSNKLITYHMHLFTAQRHLLLKLRFSNNSIIVVVVEILILTLYFSIANEQMSL